MKKKSQIILTVLILLALVAGVFLLTACQYTLDGVLNALEQKGGTITQEGPGNNDGTAPGTITKPGITYTGSMTLQASTGVVPPQTQMVASVVPSVVIVKTDAGTGAGVFVGHDDDKQYSYVLTCCHVIDGASEISILTSIYSTDSKYDATLLGADNELDVAILAVDYNVEFVEAKARNISLSPIVLAEDIYAIGNPLGDGISVTKGIVSSTSKNINMEGVTMNLIQIDAAVNQGNSGGALFDSEGLLLGIVNAKSTGESVEGMGYAIRIDDAVSIFNNMIATAGNTEYNGYGYVTGKFKLGVTVGTVKAADWGITGAGVYTYVISDTNNYGSIAFTDYTKQDNYNYYDFITKISINGNQSVFNSSDSLTVILKTAKVGDTVELSLTTVRRFGNTYTVSSTSTLSFTLRQYVYGFGAD